MTWFKKVSRFVDLIIKFFNWAGLAITMLPMAFFITADAFGRYIFNHPIAGVADWARFGLLSIAFLSLGECWQRGGHVRMDLLFSRLSFRKQQILEALASLVTLFCYAILSWQTFKEFLFSLEVGGKTDTAHIPHAPFQLLMFVGSVLFCLLLVVWFIRSVYQSTRKSDEMNFS